MAAEQAVIRVVREALEGVLSPDLATAVLFEALGGKLEVPASVADFLAVVRGPLHLILVKRLGQASARSVIERIEEVLHVDAPTGQHTKVPESERATLAPSMPSMGFDDPSTAKMPRLNEGIAVVILASGRRLANVLIGSFGSTNVRVVSVDTGDRLVAALQNHQPALVVIDAIDTTSVDTNALVDAIGLLPRGTMRALWGADAAQAPRLLDAIEAMGPCVSLVTDGGFEPLFDLVRSRINSRTV